MLGRTYENYRMVSNMCQAHAPNTDKSDFLGGRIKGKDQKNEFGTTIIAAINERHFELRSVDR
ncbi:MAG: hypothetical protein JRF30_10730 [Deltaproteobacteria bacterium]|nr:hypothetical protein [Deltaproteobacteria bacterium]MBW1792903.1 hypothetical protein [Deltaproteobacteria bacterium]MBW2331370.1 hypothetical protein [Deltaproteobacteria bacterium]